MKRWLLTTLLLLPLLPAEGQRYAERVYLKNGSIINGMVIEQIPDSILKVRTSDGSLFVYRSDEVAKITKERIDFFPSDTVPPAMRYPWAAPQKGYRAMIDIVGTIPVGVRALGLMEVSTSHGYQFSPYFFLGGGFSIAYNFVADLYMPFFVHARGNFLDGRVVPFVDAKLGYSVFYPALYFSPMVGVAWPLIGRRKMNCGLGYTYLYDTDRLYGAGCGGLAVKIGFEL